MSWLPARRLSIWPLLLCLGCAAVVRAQAQAPTITSFTPTSGPVGTSVIINGANFTPPLESITFGGNTMAAGSYTISQVTTVVPAGATTGPITIVTSHGSVTSATVFTVGASAPVITSSTAVGGMLGTTFTYQITASNTPTSYDATGLPAGLSVDQTTGIISGTLTVPGIFSLAVSATNLVDTGNATVVLTVSPFPFFTDETALNNAVYYLSFPNGNYFGYYSYLTDPDYIYHFDLGYEYVFDANDGKAGVYFYDFASSGFFYTSPTFPFPYLYDFALKTTLYYYPDTTNAGHYTSNPRYFFNFATGKIITK